MNQEEYSEHYSDLWHCMYNTGWSFKKYFAKYPPEGHDWKNIPGRDGDQKILKACTKCHQEISLLKEGDLKWFGVLPNSTKIIKIEKCSVAVMRNALL